MSLLITVLATHGGLVEITGRINPSYLYINYFYVLLLLILQHTVNTLTPSYLHITPRSREQCCRVIPSTPLLSSPNTLPPVFTTTTNAYNQPLHWEHLIHVCAQAQNSSICQCLLFVFCISQQRLFHRFISGNLQEILPNLQLISLQVCKRRGRKDNNIRYILLSE